ncbi:ATP-binding protein [Peribacillus loiseleuriae]
MTAALLDRLTHRSYINKDNGESYRLGNNMEQRENGEV